VMFSTRCGIFIHRAGLPIAAAAALSACHGVVSAAPHPDNRASHFVVPAPLTIDVSPTDSFPLTPRTAVYVDAAASPEVQAIGDYTANMISLVIGATARRLPVASPTPDSSITLLVDAMRLDLGDEGYELESTRIGVRVVAAQPAGLFHGVQTLRQLFPAGIEHQGRYNKTLKLPVAHVVDKPRFGWRGGMLDVSRHFLPPADVKRFIDLYALYKLNRLHLHLSDDQGWRIEIKSWPRLTELGSGTAIGGAPGGFYTQAEYADIVAYARSRYITVVPEIDMPGHINAALIAYPDLRCDRVAPPPFARVGGPPNSLCVTRDSVYGFVSDVVREIATAAPTPYFHIGGDEVQRMSKDDYRNFITRVEQIVTTAGPRMIGWGEIAPVSILPNTIVQHWTKDSVVLHAQRGGKVILSPGPHAYLDMKYDSSTTLGLMWAGLIDLKRAYDWDPATLIPGVGEPSILGVEGPLWAETLLLRADYEYMEFPRIIALAELAWSSGSRLGWDDFRRRIGGHGARLAALGVNFARVPGVDWTW
jgi:hexosaminidase